MEDKKVSRFHFFLWKVKVSLREQLRRVHYRKLLAGNREFQNRYAGKRCFVIGTGPSLTAEDLTALQDEYTFASNSIFRYFDKTEFRPDFYSVCDRTYYLANREKCDAVTANIKKFFPLDFGLEFGLKEGNGYYSRIPFSVRHPRFHTDAAWGLQDGSTVTYYLLQLAAYMGFSEIYLLGIDFNYSLSVDNKGNVIQRDGVKDYAFADKAANYTMPNLEASYYAYESAECFSRRKNAGFRIMNATRGGKLEVFERRSVDEVLAEQGEKRKEPVQGV